jgi:hypothetical protein
VEDRGVRGIQLVGAIGLAHRGDVHRQLARQQRAHLHRAGVRAHHQVALHRLDVERVLQGARRVVLVEVQGVEVVPLVLELGALADLPAHRDEQVAHLLHEKGEWMASAASPARRHLGDVQGFARELGGLLRGEDRALLRRQRRVHLRARLADELARRRLLIRGHVAQRGIELRERRVLPRVRGARGLQTRGIAGGRDRGERGIDRRGDGLLGDRGSVRHENRV